MDGCCRHVIATVFDIINTTQDHGKASVTSGPCLWVRRGTETEEAIPVDCLETSVVTAQDTAYVHYDYFTPKCKLYLSTNRSDYCFIWQLC